MTSCDQHHAPDTTGGAHTHPETSAALETISRAADTRHQAVTRLLAAGGEQHAAMDSKLAQILGFMERNADVFARIAPMVETLAKNVELATISLNELVEVAKGQDEALAALHTVLTAQQRTLESHARHLARSGTADEATAAALAEAAATRTRHGEVLDRTSKALTAQNASLVQIGARVGLLVGDVEGAASVPDALAAHGRALDAVAATLGGHTAALEAQTQTLGQIHTATQSAAKTLTAQEQDLRRQGGVLEGHGRNLAGIAETQKSHGKALGVILEKAEAKS